MKINLNSKEQKITMISIVFTIVVFLYYFLTFIIFGQNSVITIFDNLTSNNIPVYKMLHDEKLFFKFDAPTKAFDGMSTLFLMNVNYSFQCLLYAFMNTFWATAVIRYLQILLGFFSMYLLLRKCFSCPVYISILVSLCFSISVKQYDSSGIAESTIPFIVYVFYYFSVKCNKKFSPKSLLILLYAGFSSFAIFGLFICLFWFLGMAFQTLKNKKINCNLLVGFISLCLGYVLVDFRMFYVMFILRTPLNRDIPYFNIQAFIIFPLVKNLENFYVWLNYYLNYEYSRSRIITKLILPFAIIIMLICIYFKSHNSAQNNSFLKVDKKFNLVKNLLIFHFLAVFIITLYTMFFIPISEHMSVLTKINITRILWFGKTYLLVIFALCLEKIYYKKTVYLEVQGEAKENMEIGIKPFISVICIFFLVAINIFSVQYGDDTYKTWSNYIKTKMKVYREETTYKEFYSEQLFAEIKQDISYSNEKVATYGFHPAVLIYNGFNCIDGYNNSYPLSYMEKFRELINPILSLDYYAVNWFNYWGGMLYIYNVSYAMNWQPLLDKYNFFEHDLQVDMDVLRENFGVKYILSANQLSNADDIGLSLIKVYDYKDSIYTIYLYNVI